MAFEPLIVKAIFAFKGTNNDELCFNKNDLITITQKEEGGWWEGTLGEKTGWFPSNYVREIRDANIMQLQSNQHDATNLLIVYKDLLDSEKAHLAELQGLVTNFLIPLERSTILTSDEYKQLIGNFMEVLETHRELLKLIEDDHQRTHKDQRIGRSFLNFAPRMKSVHKTYCALHPKAVCILDKYRDELTKYMESCGANSPGVLVLTTGLSKPFRRLAKYSGMLLEVERYVEDSHPDRGDIQRSVAIYKELNTICASTRRQKELELQVLTGPVRGWEGQPLSTLGDIIYMGSVAVGLQHLDRYLVLFPSTLLILSVSHRLSAFIYEGKLPVTGITVNRLEDSDQYKNAFEICGPLIDKVTAVCQSRDEANHWVEMLKCYNSNRLTYPQNNQKALPSQAEMIPQPPPHLNQRGYCTRISIQSNFLPYNYKPTFPSPYYPPASPYAGLSKYYDAQVKLKVITKKLLKHLLYSEFLKPINPDEVKKRVHMSALVATPNSRRAAGAINKTPSPSTHVGKGWSVNSLRPSPPLRPCTALGNTPSRLNRKPLSFKDDALILEVVESYFSNVQARNTVNSAVVVKSMSHESENINEVIKSLRKKVKDIECNMEMLSSQLTEERAARWTLQTIIKRHLNSSCKDMDSIEWPTMESNILS